MNAQNSFMQHEIDSTLEAMKSVKADTARIYALVTLSKLYGLSGDYLKCISYAEDALRLSEKVNWKKGILDSYNNIGIAKDHLGNYSEALKNYLAAAKISTEINDKQGIGNAYNNIAR